MDLEYYLNRFKKAAKKLDKKLLKEKNLEVATGIVMDSACLKLYKKEWANDKNNPIQCPTRIFFSIWVHDKTIKEEKLFYNIHALKLRHLEGYAITSRDFAESFRETFKTYEHNWKDVSVKFGPLTLMEGWEKLDLINLENTIVKLASNFLEIEFLVEDTLQKFKKNK
ncbi:MAG: hypothetical protein ABIP30_01525 [Ferruginibacter sp.]